MKKIMIYIGVVLAVGMVGLGRLGGVYAADENLPDLYIRAVNPGYKIDGLNNVGEMIEISRKSSDKPISLAGVAVGYTNTSGNHSTLFEFPENSFMTGETILLRLASSPNSELAAVNYTKTLAMKGGIDLTVSGEAAALPQARAGPPSPSSMSETPMSRSAPSRLSTASSPR